MDLKSSLRSLLDLPARRTHRAALRGLARSAGPEPVLSFGGVLDGDGLVHGGAVKLLHLQKAFATDPARFCVLYLVSSAQPRFARDLAEAARERGIRFVWNQNGVGYPAWAGREAERHNAPMRALRAMADHVIYQSAFCRESAETFLGPHSGPSSVLFNPVDLDAFCPAREPPPASPVRLLAMGTQNYAGRVLSALDGLHVLRRQGVEATLTVAGKLQWRDAAAQVERHIARLGLTGKVVLLPPFSQAEAVRLYQSHHVVLHPKYLDPCPTVAIEALACGVPVVGSGSGGMPELVPPDCGRLIPAPTDWNRMITPEGGALAEAVADLLPRLEDFRRAARRHAEAAFSSAAWVDAHREICRGLLA